MARIVCALKINSVTLCIFEKGQKRTMLRIVGPLDFLLHEAGLAGKIIPAQTIEKLNQVQAKLLPFHPSMEEILPAINDCIRYYSDLSEYVWGKAMPWRLYGTRDFDDNVVEISYYGVPVANVFPPSTPDGPSKIVLIQGIPSTLTGRRRIANEPNVAHELTHNVTNFIRNKDIVNPDYRYRGKVYDSFYPGVDEERRPVLQPHIIAQTLERLLEEFAVRSQAKIYTDLRMYIHPTNAEALRTLLRQRVVTNTQRVPGGSEDFCIRYIISEYTTVCLGEEVISFIINPARTT